MEPEVGQAPKLAFLSLGDAWPLCRCLALPEGSSPHLLWDWGPSGHFFLEWNLEKRRERPLPHLTFLPTRTPMKGVVQAAEKPAVSLLRHLLPICLIAERKGVKFSGGSAVPIPPSPKPMR